MRSWIFGNKADDRADRSSHQNDGRPPSGPRVNVATQGGPSSQAGSVGDGRNSGAASAPFAGPTPGDAVGMCSIATNSRNSTGQYRQDRESPGSHSQEMHRSQQPERGRGQKQQHPQWGGGGGGGMIQALMAGRATGSQAVADAEMERKVSVAARNLGDGVQKIVMAAKMGGGQGGRPMGEQGGSNNPDEWKIRLLHLLGGSDDDVESAQGALASDLGILLANSSCDKFVLRCVENELPPNLIHCLRLLRVLELQHAHAAAAIQQSRGGYGKSSGPISTVATAKVAKLLCLLCTDTSVGEQLRPHLFGLLALSGASYPLSGVHVASAASSVILAFSESCLSSSLVWFLHDRKMIVHMTDDVKELCGMTTVSSPSSVTLCLYGKAAEAAGLWVVALRTVVHLVTSSCHYQCLELLRDFDAAGGYHVLCYAIANSGTAHVQKLLELVTTLVCCKTDTSTTDTKHGISQRAAGEDQVGRSASEQPQPPGHSDPNSDVNEFRLASNPNAFEIVEDLMVRSVPLLTHYVETHEGQRPVLSSRESVRELARFSVETVWAVRSSPTRKNQSRSGDTFDLASELLVTTLQLYSDHGKNYSIIESRYNILAHYLLAFPTFSDVSLKVLILKTLEYVYTGVVSGKDSDKPLSVICEVLISLCKSLLEEVESNETELFGALIQDACMLCDTLEKLLHFDEAAVSQSLVECGLLKDNLGDFLQLIMDLPHIKDCQAAEGMHRNTDLQRCPASCAADGAYSVVCRILKMVCNNSSLRSGLSHSDRNGTLVDRGTPFERNLKLFLTIGVKDMGEESSVSALSVFEAKMSVRHDATLQQDMDCLMDLLFYLSGITGHICVASAAMTPLFPSEGADALDGLDLDLETKSALVERFLSREAKIISTVQSVMESNESAQEVFRVSRGYECLAWALFCLEGVFDGKEQRKGGILEGNGAKVIMKMLESVFASLDASTSQSSRNNKKFSSFSETAHSPNAVETPSDHESLAMSGSMIETASKANRVYLRQKNMHLALSAAVAATGILNSPRYARQVVNHALGIMDPSLNVSAADDDEERRRRATGDAVESPVLSGSTFVRNPDAARIVLGVAVLLPDTISGIALAKRALDEMLRLCATDMSGTTLSQIAQSGLCRSLTSPKEFSSFLEDRSHHLYSRFVLLLRRVASFSMTYMDFVALLRCVAGPILLDDSDDKTDPTEGFSAKKKRILLPVISSSVPTSFAPPPIALNMSDRWQARETDFCSRLETLSVIAERGDRVARCELGGDSLNTIALYMQKTSVEERLYTLAEQGRIKFTEVESVEESTKTASLVSGSTPVASNSSSVSATEKIWSVFSSTGFTYSMWLRLPLASGEGAAGNLFVLTLSSAPGEKLAGSSGETSVDYLSVWYDLQSQRFNVLSSSSSRSEPTSFPVSPLISGVWHHIFLTFQPPKRAVLSRKSILGICVDGRPLESEVKIESIILPPTARMHVGVPNPVLASSGIVRGSLPTWELGPTLFLSGILGTRDATSMFAAGPDFQGMFWGDRPQRLSLAATATATFAMLAESGEQGSVAGALRRRGVPEVEAAGHVMRERGFGGGPMAGPESDLLTAVGLLCSVAADNIICGFRASANIFSARDSSSSKSKAHFSRRLVNVARINSSSELVSTDAAVYGVGSIVSPNCFADNVQWIGGPNVLLPIVNAARSASSMALALRLIRESVHRHPPNLETLQAGGGYRMLGLLLRQKKIMDASILDQSFAFAVHGFVPGSMKDQQDPNVWKQGGSAGSAIPSMWSFSDRWVFSDLDAMKYLLLNHQVWDLRGSGPDLPMRLLSFLNGLVAAHSAHAAFNSRRLHLLGIIRWTLHLMLEASELYTAGAVAIEMHTGGAVPDFKRQPRFPDRGQEEGTKISLSIAALASGWYVDPPCVATIAVGGDPDNALLLGCKTLLRRVLTFMLTPGDLEAIAGAAIYTVSIGGSAHKDGIDLEASCQQQGRIAICEDEKLQPGPVARVYLLRLLEELVVDGVNEIVTASNEKKGQQDSDGIPESTVQPHAGGGTSSNQSYLAMSMMVRRRNNRSNQPGQGPLGDATMHPKHQQAQAFLSAFAGILTPVWFACLLEGCREEASASAVLRLMILMLQSSPTFAAAFEEAGGFAPLVLSIPKFSTCASITMSMLSQLLHAPILHLPCFGTLDASQLCEVFDAESDASELIMKESIQGGLHTPSDPSCGIFALLAECLGRNIQLSSFDNELGSKARRTNEAVLQLLSHRHTFSSSFQEFCRTPDFLEPLAQALCLVHDEKLQRMQEGNHHGLHFNQNSPAHENQKGCGRQDGTGRGNGDSNASLDVVEGNDFMSWPSASRDNGEEQTLISRQRDPMRTARRGSLSEANTEETPTERFVGKGGEEGEGSGIGMVHLLHLVLSHAVLSGPLAAPLVSALFRSFPIHASPDQVEAFHLVLIEHCRSVVEDALQRGEPISLANCVGVSSVLLDRLMAGFFTSEPVLEAVKIVLSTLGSITASGTYASRTLSNAEQNMLVADCAHLARLTCLTALQRSRPMGPYDEGDDDLKMAVLDAVSRNLRQLLLTPASFGAVSSSSKRQAGSGGGGLPPPAPGSRIFPLWQSASLARCCPPSVACTYPDLAAVDEPDRAFVVALMAEIHIMLLDKRRDIREQAVVIVVALLQQRRGIMSELLITDISRGDGRTETVDLMNRGGFGALLVAHEAATIAENISTVPRRRSLSRRGSGGSASSGGKMKYASFFEWLDRNQAQVASVFHGIHIQASRLLPGIDVGASSPEEAIENEQKVMLLKLTSQDSSDRTILGGLERAELAQRSHDKTAESHALWKRQGFDDLSSGAMQWKFLLRQLKGSCSIWEGGVVYGFHLFHPHSVLARLVKRKNEIEPTGKWGKLLTREEEPEDGKQPCAVETVTRWKLDLTEGYERQRRRLLPNYEFFSLYNLDETIDTGGGKPGEIKAPSKAPVDADTGTELPPVLSDQAGSQEYMMQEGRSPEDGAEDGTRRNSIRHSAIFAPASDGMQATAATAALLREMKIGTVKDDDDDYDLEGTENDEGGEEPDVDGSTLLEEQQQVVKTSGTAIGDEKEKDKEVKRSLQAGTSERETDAQTTDRSEGQLTDARQDNVLASSYDLITGLLQAGDWPEKSYNIKRCTGLEVRQALLLWCREAIYIIDGFEQTDGEGLEGKINRLEKSHSTYYINLRPKEFVSVDPATDPSQETPEWAGEVQVQQPGAEDRGDALSERNRSKEKEASSEEITYHHRSQRIAFHDLYSVYRRRYQLQQIALEFYDVHRNGTLIAFSNNAEREEVLSKILSSPLPNSIFSSSILGGSTSINYKKFMSSLRAKITTQWVQGRMTNFDFIMHLNSFAGRSYNDLTQYPVFPWILADYDSDEIDLNDSSVYRDLSKAMGAQGEARAEQFRERYEALEGNYRNDDEPPPFHYGTHYSCAAYVLYYLMRLEPFSRLALSLQGGRFDVADRLFHNVGASWRSASTENLQDVRELIPEFFYLPEFLENRNMFDFGVTQLGKTVHHVTLPPWAKGDPRRFIRINRQALESEYVSKNLHKWADLIFGYKQRGREAIAALNTFVHVTYEGQVDLENIKDPIQRDSIIAQIQNFGQTPSRLERKPFPPRNVATAVKEKSIDFSALSSLSALTPPFCIVGAPHRVYLRVTMWDTCRVGMAGQADSSVGDMCLVKGQLVGVGKTCALILPSKKYYRFGGPNNGVSVHVATTSARYREVNRVLSIHDGMHRAPISVAKPSLNGLWLVTGCIDSTVRVWKYDGHNVKLQATLCGHEGGHIMCVDVSTTFGTIVSGDADGNVLVWDLRTLTFLRQLMPVSSRDHRVSSSAALEPAVSVSINHKNGNILSLVGSRVSLFDINGSMLASHNSDTHVRPSCAVATDCPEWMVEGVVAVTGHVNGDVRMWCLDYDRKQLIMRHILPDKVHSCPITAMRVSGDRQDTLLVGDKSGKMSVCKTLQLEALNQQELSMIVQEMRTGKSGALKYDEAGKSEAVGVQKD